MTAMKTEGAAVIRSSPNGRPNPHVWVVTGGSRGIGRAVVLHAAEKGARVVFCARQLGQAAWDVIAEAKQRGGNAIAIEADVRDEVAVERVFALAQQAYGRVDIVVCNAGVAAPRLLLATDRTAWDQVVGTNLGGAFVTCRSAVRAFRAAGRRGQIVLVGSVMQHGAPSQAAYAASKGGLVGLLESLSCDEKAPAAYTSLIVVGFVDTSITADIPEALSRRWQNGCALKRVASAEEVADTIGFLATDGAALFHGRALDVNGGTREVSL